MARTLAELPAGSRITDYISLGVIAKFFPVEKIHEVLEQTKRASVRERDLPAHVVVYYVIALALYMRSSYREVLRCLLEGVQWLLDPSAKVKVAGKSGISQARSRLGAEPLKKLYAAVVAPIAEKRTKGAWYRQWRLVSLDGSTLDVADTTELPVCKQACLMLTYRRRLSQSCQPERKRGGGSRTRMGQFYDGAIHAPSNREQVRRAR